MSRVALHLEAEGFQTFLPHRDGLERVALPIASRLGRLSALTPGGATLQRAIFALDLFQLIERCEGLVFNMNGRVPDEGAVAETAIAYATGKAVVLYKEDARSMLGGLDNPMLLGLSPAFSTVPTLSSIAPALRDALEVAPGPGPTPAHLARTLDFGRRVWALLGPWRARQPTTGSEVELLHGIASLDAPDGARSPSGGEPSGEFE